MPTDIPKAASRKGGFSLQALLMIALTFYAMVALAMVHATMVAAPDVFLASAP